MKTQFACLALAFVLLPPYLSAQWVQTSASTGHIIECLAVSGTNLFAGTAGGGVFLSADSGTSWTAVNTGLTDNSVWDLAVSGTNLFAGTYLGVFLSTTNGTSWTAASTGLTNTCVTALAISGTNLFAGTYFAGIWRRPLSEMITDVERRELLPPSFALEQNYPNPFNPNSNIRYQISEFRYIKLAVYDLLGREVAVLVNERKAPGKYEVNFDGSNLAGGVYFYRLQAGDFTQTKRLLLLK